MAKHRKKGEDADAGMLTFNGYAVVYSDRVEPRKASTFYEPATFLKDARRGPRVFRNQTDAEQVRDEMASKFTTGIWRVIPVELREVASEQEIMDAAAKAREVKDG